MQHCPSWCDLKHGTLLGEEDWVHESQEFVLESGRRACLVMTATPGGSTDGPFVLVDDIAYTLPQAKELGISLIALTDLATSSPPRAAR